MQKTNITKIAIIKTDCKLSLSQVVEQQKCNYAINGGLYAMQTGVVNPIPLRIDGKTIATSKDGYWCLAWNIGPDICMIHSNDMSKWRNVLACAAMVKDYQNTIFSYTKSQGGIRGRTGIGEDPDYLHLFVTTDKSGACSPAYLRSQMKTKGVRNAIMLDCGGSSQGYFNGQFVQYEKRKVAYWICIWTKEDKPTSTQIVKCPYKEPIITVKSGTRGEPAKWVQWHLVQAGYDIGTIDGVFGKNSTNALVMFQKSKGLVADGLCGRLTREKLKAELKE